MFEIFMLQGFLVLQGAFLIFTLNVFMYSTQLKSLVFKENPTACLILECH